MKLLKPNKLNLLFLLFILNINFTVGQKLSGNIELTTPANSCFGSEVSVYGQFAAVSAPNEDYGDIIYSGAVYIYKISKGKWEFYQKIIPPDPTEDMRRFGTSIALHGNLLLINSPGDDVDKGTVYFYKYNGSLWIEENKIEFPSQKIFYGFGYSLDLIGSYAAISSEKNDENNSASGAVYLFKIVGDKWIFDGSIISPETNGDDIFGHTVKIVNSKHILISAPRGNGIISNSGVVYSYVKSEEDWILNQKINSSEGLKGGLFGCSISYSQRKLIIGAMEELADSAYSGSAYFYQLNELGKWELAKRILPQSQRDQDYFGSTVFINKDIALIGSPKSENKHLSIVSDLGSTEVYSLSDSGWNFVGEIVPEDGKDDDHFGMSISLYENELAIGSGLIDNNSLNDGAVYFYKLDKLFPNLSSKIIPASFTLYNNFPNPFNPSTTIRYDLPLDTKVNLTIYDILGRKVIELINSDEIAGRKEIIWNGKNSAGFTVASGVYFYRIRTPEFINVKKMIMLK